MVNSSIIPAPPSLAGLAWREITRDDLTALVDLASACFLVDGGIHFLFEPDSISSRFFPDLPGAAIGAFDPDGHLAACATIHFDGDSGWQRARIVGHVRPDIRNRGIGNYLMRWSQIQARPLRVGSTNNDQPVLEIATESLTDSAHRLYHAHGFETVTESLVMRRDLHLPMPDCPLPPGVTLTNWQPTLSDQFFQAYDAAFCERPGFPGWSAAEWVDSWTTDNFRPEWSLLARADNVPLGFLTAAANPPHGFVVQVGVIPSHRRLGLGSALIVETMRRMQSAGTVSIQLTVNVNNPGAIQAYAELGFTTIGRRGRYERIAGQ